MQQIPSLFIEVQNAQRTLWFRYRKSLLSSRHDYIRRKSGPVATAHHRVPDSLRAAAISTVRSTVWYFRIWYGDSQSGFRRGASVIVARSGAAALWLQLQGARSFSQRRNRQGSFCQQVHRLVVVRSLLAASVVKFNPS